MASFSEEDADTLRKLRGILNNVNRGPRLTGQDDIEKKFKILSDNLKDMDGSFGGLTRQFKSIISESIGLNRVLKGMRSSIEDNIELLDADSKRAARHAEDQLKAGKTNISQIMETSKALREYKEALLKFRSAQDDFAKKDKELSEARAKARRAKGHKARASEAANVKRATASRDRVHKELSDAANSFKASMTKLDSDKLLGIAGLDKATINLGTSFKRLKSDTDAQDAALKALEGRENALHIVSNAGITSMNSFVTGIKGKLAALPRQLARALVRGMALAGKQVFTDVQANARFFTPGLHYLQNPLLGISQAERAEIVGTNRTNLRLLGAGSAEGGIGQLGITSAAQTASRQFGIINPADAMKFFLQNQQLSMMMGSSGTIKATTENMNAMSNMRKVVGVTTDELNDFYQSMVQNGMLTQRGMQLSNLNDRERTQALDSELKRRLELNKVMGVSVDLYKQQVAQRMAKQMHTGIGEFFKNVIMGQISFQTMGIASTPQMQELLQRAELGDPNARSAIENISSARQAQIAQSSLSTINKFGVNSTQGSQAKMNMLLPGTFLPMSDIGGNVAEGSKQIAQSFAQFRNLTGSTMSQPDFVNKVLIPLQTQRGLNPNTKIPKWAEPLFNNQANQNIGDEQTEKTSAALGTLANRAFEAAGALHGIKGNPIGQILSGAGSVLLGGIGLKIMEKVGGSLIARYMGERAVSGAAGGAGRGFGGMLGKLVPKGLMGMLGLGGGAEATGVAGAGVAGSAGLGAGRLGLAANLAKGGVIGYLATLPITEFIKHFDDGLSPAVRTLDYKNFSPDVNRTFSGYADYVKSHRGESVAQNSVRNYVEQLKMAEEKGKTTIRVDGKDVPIESFISQLLDLLKGIDKNTDKTATASKQQVEEAHSKSVADKLARYGNMRQVVMDSVVNKLGSV